MRHEVPVLVPDPFLYAEKDGKKLTASTAFEVERIRAAGIEAHALGGVRLRRDARGGCAARRDHGASSTSSVPRARAHDAVVPEALPRLVADHLRANGVDSRPTTSSSPIGAA